MGGTKGGTWDIYQPGGGASGHSNKPLDGWQCMVPQQNAVCALGVPGPGVLPQISLPLQVPVRSP